MMVTHLKLFRDMAAREEQDLLVERVGTTREYLFSTLGVHRDIPVEKAARIEAATREIAAANGGRTPVIYRSSLCAVCGACPLARQALGCGSRVDGS